MKPNFFQVATLRKIWVEAKLKISQVAPLKNHFFRINRRLLSLNVIGAKTDNPIFVTGRDFVKTHQCALGRTKYRRTGDKCHYVPYKTLQEEDMH